MRNMNLSYVLGGCDPYHTKIYVYIRITKKRLSGGSEDEHGSLMLWTVIIQ